MMRKHLSSAFLVVIVLILSPAVYSVHATVVYQLESFTDNGSYYDSPDLDLNVEIVDKQSHVDFIFNNDSLIDCSIARIYLQSNAFLGYAEIVNGPGTSFSWYPTPHNLPGGKTLEPSFIAAYDLSMDSDPPVPKNGINPGEWLKTTFALINNGTFINVVDELNTGNLRIGAHVIGLPDGSSESAVITAPEPTTLSLLGLGALAILRKSRTRILSFTL